MRGCASVVLLAAIVFPLAASAEMRPVRLRCEYLKDPLGVDVTPRLSWALESSARDQIQGGYQILVASSEATLHADRGDLWDTGRVASAESLNIAYAGRPLSSGVTAFWKVRVWDAAVHAGPFSEPARWEMGLLQPADWKGRWIADPRPLPENETELYNERPAPLFRKEFTAARPVRRARAYVSGLGYYVMAINGRRVGDHVLDPIWTSYGKRVLYSTYDVTDLLKPGPNAVGITVGNGWYNPLPLRFWGWLNLRQHLIVGQPRTILQLNLEYTDGTSESVFTDESWRLADGPVLKNNIYLGEVYDARREVAGWTEPGFDDSAWKQAVAASGEVGPLRAQMLPPVRVGQKLPPAKVIEPAPGVYIFDMGQNFAGWVTLRVRAEAGTRIQLRYGELLHPDNTLNVMTSVAGQVKQPGAGGPGAPDVAFQSDVYICKGGGVETYTPQFTFHGFRYVEVTGLNAAPSLDALEGSTLHCAVDSAGEFACSNDLFNRIQEITRRTLLSNLFGVQSDCPHRERFGYGGDIIATSEMAMYNFDMAAFYVKSLIDHSDAARPNHGITETAPFVGIDAFEDGLGGGAAPIGWGTVHPVLLAQLFQYYGDKRLIAENYPVSAAWLEFLTAQARELCIEKGIGDHETLAPKVTPLTSTGFYYMNAELLTRLARILDKRADADHSAALASSIKTAFNRRFLDPKTGKYATGTQACQAFALFLGLVPPSDRDRAVKVLLEDIAAQKDHLTTGIFGTKFMLMTLAANGHADAAYKMVDQRDFPGWGHMLERGATTLWEHWEFSDNTYSHNHPMFGSVSEWFFKVLAGIQPDVDAVGFDHIVIRPAIVPGLTWVKARHDSIRGPIVSEWALADGTLKMHIIIPPNSRALLHIPSADTQEIREGDRCAQQAEGLRVRAIESDRTVFAAGSGDYHFTMPWPPKTLPPAVR